jgi:basic membrane protein A
MRSKSTRFAALAMVASVAIAATACGSDDDKSSASSTKVCEVTDTGGVDDKGFNASAHQGVLQGEKELGTESELLESKTDADYAPNIQKFIGDKCTLIVTVGFLLDSATSTAAKANPGTQFAIVDSTGLDQNGTPDDFSDDKKLPNVRALQFSSDQPSFLAGYLAASVTKTGKVGTYGGINIPTVTIFMTGFLNGVKYYNTQKGKNVQVLGWDGKDGTFAGNFEKIDDGKRIAQSQLDDGADIVFPVAGPVGQGSAALATELGPDKLMIIGVDTDQYVSNSKDKGVYLVSVLKNIQASVFDTIQQVTSTGKIGDDYEGTLANDGVGLSSFHDLDSKVSATTKTELDQLKADIISGKVKVGS